jgi:uncharacterized membrane protein (UPF0136 family)
VGWLDISLLIYALVMLGGGIGGYVSAGSLPSLISGIVSGILLLASVALARSNPKLGYGLAALTALILVGVFIERYMKTHKAMPSLGLIGLSALMLVLLAVGHFMKKS